MTGEAVGVTQGQRLSRITIIGPVLVVATTIVTIAICKTDKILSDVH